ncbi:MAG: LuxR family transcriptional regulator [Clostridia bacterium]|nr:LuxR family transcriptional regulator [Clostridia bacterium]
MKEKKTRNDTLRLKLFLLLAILVVSIISCVLVILIITGTFTAGIRETASDVSQELDHFSEDITTQYGQISAHTVEFSKDLSKDLETELALQGLEPADLKNHPEILESLIGKEYDKSLFALQKANSSGVFFLLDATVNPALDSASNSKSGLYIKNMEPNILSSSSEFLLILRGSSSIGRQNNVTLHPQWRMEFDVTDAPYYHAPVDAARSLDLPISRLFYWSEAITLPGTTEQVMLCSAPLVDSKGNVFGVCGFEVSAMLFKLTHMPNESVSQRLICIMAPGSDKTLHTSQALVSAGYSVRSFKDQNQILSIREDHPFNAYRQQDGTLFSGIHHSISLYPEGSAFENEKWMVALIMPDEDISASVISLNIKLLLLFFGLLIIGITLCYYISKKFLMPVSKGIQMIKSNDYASRTNIAEIDDLIEFLSSAQSNRQAESAINGKQKILHDNVFDEFVKNTKLLSPAERAVFNLYVEGYTATEITKILCLSINTIKTHNKRIYMKLNVASREELLVYVTMLKDAGEEL